MWDLALAMALGIFLSVMMFFGAFLLAYVLARGFLFTGKMIKKAWEATKKESK